MKLKGFLLSEYDNQTIALQSVENGKQSLLTREEFAVFRRLNENENLTILDLFLPEQGFAQCKQIQISLKTIVKLRELDLIQNASNPPTSAEEATNREPLRLESMNAMAATILGLSERLLSAAGKLPLLFFLIALCFAYIFFFPKIQFGLDFDFPYSNFFLDAFFAAVLGLSSRSIIQAAYLKTHGREAKKPSFAFLGFIPYLSGDFSEKNLLGKREKILLSFLGLFAPLAFGGSAIVFYWVKMLSFVPLVSILLVSWGLFLLSLCPFAAFDGAEILEILLGRKSLQQTISIEFKENSLFSSLWFLLWFGSLYLCWRIFSPLFIHNLIASISNVDKGGAIFGILVVVFLFSLPVLEIIASSLQEKRNRKILKEKFSKENEGKEFSFQDRVDVLDKIPLFSVLNNKDRLELYNKMQVHFFADRVRLVKQGEIGQDFFVLVRGKAVAYHKDVNGKVRNLSPLYPGDAFGEIALIDEVPRTASIASAGGCVALLLKKEQFSRFFEVLGDSDRVKQMIRLSSFFRAHPFFSKLKVQDQAMLINAFQFQTMRPGEDIPILRNGENYFYVVYSGSISVETGSAEPIRLVSEDFFGYSGAMSHSYKAQEGASLLSLKLSEFQSLVMDKYEEERFL